MRGTGKGRVEVITKKVSLAAGKIVFFIKAPNARIYWPERAFFHKDSSKEKIVSILP